MLLDNPIYTYKMPYTRSPCMAEWVAPGSVGVWTSFDFRANLQVTVRYNLRRATSGYVNMCPLKMLFSYISIAESSVKSSAYILMQNENMRIHLRNHRLRIEHRFHPRQCHLQAEQFQ